MKNSEVFDNLMYRLGNRRTPPLRAQLVIEFNNKMNEVEKGAELPWFLEDRWEISTIASQDYLVLPDTFSREVEEGRFKLLQPAGGWRRLKKMSLEALEDKYDDATAGIPEAYALFGERVYFGPKPDAIYSLKLPYFKTSASVFDNDQVVSNKWLLQFYNYFTLTLLDQVARMQTRDDLLVKLLQQPLIVATRAFTVACEARQHANMDYLLDNVEN